MDADNTFVTHIREANDMLVALDQLINLLWYLDVQSGIRAIEVGAMSSCVGKVIRARYARDD